MEWIGILLSALILWDPLMGGGGGVREGLVTSEELEEEVAHDHTCVL